MKIIWIPFSVPSCSLEPIGLFQIVNFAYNNSWRSYTTYGGFADSLTLRSSLSREWSTFPSFISLIREGSGKVASNQSKTHLGHSFRGRDIRPTYYLIFFNTLLRWGRISLDDVTSLLSCRSGLVEDGHRDFLRTVTVGVLDHMTNLTQNHRFQTHLCPAFQA